MATRAAAQRGIARDALVNTAAGLFAKQGYRATSLDDVASALGMKKASLYHYIDSKESLLTEIYHGILDRIEAAVIPLASTDLPPDERLRRMIHTHVSVVAAERDMLAVVFREEAELPDSPRRAIRRRKLSYNAVFESVVAEGVHRGVFNPLPPRITVNALLGMCNWMYQWYSPKGTHSADDIAAMFTLLFESGLARDGEPRTSARPRAGTLDEAFEDLGPVVDSLKEKVEELSIELSKARDRLRDGLAG